MPSETDESNAAESIRLGPLNLDLDLWLRGWIAIVLASLVALAHSLYGYVLQIFFGEEMKQLHKLFVAMGEIALVSIDAWLLIEAVRIFLPPPLGIKLITKRESREQK